MKNNKKRLLSAVLSVGMILSAIPSAGVFAQGEVKQIYVSANASGGTGTKDSPMGLEQALISAAQQAKSMSAGSVEVILGVGTYRLDETLQLGDDINGTDTVELAIVGDEGALPRITMSKQIPNDKFAKVTDTEVLKRIPQQAKNSIYAVNMRELGLTKYGQPSTESNIQTFEVFWDSELMTVAKWPNDDRSATIDGTGRALAGDTLYTDAAAKKYTFTIDTEPQRLESWKTATDTRVWGNLNVGWVTNWFKLAGVDPEKKSITIEGTLYRDTVQKGTPFFVSNLIEELDSPGEYYMDRATGILYIYPLGNISDADISYSVDNVSDKAKNDTEQRIINITNAKNIRLENLEISNSVGNGIGAAVKEDGSLKIRNCKILNVFSGFYSYTANNVEISGCEIANTKNQAITISGGNRQTLTPANSVVTNCYIHSCALGTRLGGAITVTGCGIDITHNLISDLPHWAFQYGGNDHRIMYNELYGCCYEAGDAGVFYTGRDMTNYGTLLQYNYIHDIRNFKGEKGVCVFYQDDQGSGYTINNNIMQRVVAAIWNGGGRDNTMIGNIAIDGFENSDAMPSCDARGYGTHGEQMRTDFWNSPHGKTVAAVPYDSEIWLEKYPQIKATVDDPERHRPFNTVFKNNIASNYMREQSGQIAPQVREFGTIENNHYIEERLSYVYDDRGIIKFTDKSEFEKLGVDWIDTSKIGVLGGGNYTIPSPEERRLYEAEVRDLAGEKAQKVEKVAYPKTELEIVDLLSNSTKLIGEAPVKKSGSSVILETGGLIGINTQKYDNFVLRGKFRTSAEFKQMPLYFRAAKNEGHCYQGNNSYSMWIKSDYMELQRWNPGSTMFDTVPSGVKTDGSWNTIEVVCNNLENGAVDIYLNLNGKTVFMQTDYDPVKITDAGYFLVSAGGAPIEFGKYEKTLNKKNELYTDKNNISEESKKEEEKEIIVEEMVSNEPVGVYIDEQEFAVDTEAYIKNGRTYVPLRAIFERMGARVAWLENSKAATAFFGDNRMYIGINQSYAVLNGEKIPTDSPAEIKNDSTMIGARFVAEMFDCEVNWLGEERIVSIFTPGYEPTGTLTGNEPETDDKEDTETKVDDGVKQSEKYNDEGEVLLLHRNLPKIYFDSSEAIKDGELDNEEMSSVVKYAEVKEDYYLRTKLQNFNYKITNQPDRKLNVVFLGGSITFNDGYRDHIGEWFTKQYGDRFNFINSGWGGTNSDMGADRVYYDVLTHDPDLVFVEFAVNDRDRNDKDIAKSMEQIIRQIWDYNNTTEVIFVYTVNQKDMEQAATGKWTQASKTMDYVAEHYGIPSVFMGRELAASVKAGEAVWNNNEVTDANKDLPVYMRDSVHPIEAGSAKYFEMVERFLTDMLVNDLPGYTASEYMQIPYLFKDSAGTKESFALDNYIDGSTLTKEEASKYIKAHKTIENVYTSDTVGDGVTFTFTGTQAGIYVIAGPDTGNIDVYVDGELVRTATGFHQVFTLGTPIPMSIKTPVLDNGKHTVSFKISESLPNKADVAGLSDEMKNSRKSTFESGFVVGILEK